MAVKEWTPIQAVGGKLVHATSLATPQKTACNKPCGGWKVAPMPLTCLDCKAAVHHRIRRKKKA